MTDAKEAIESLKAELATSVEEGVELKAQLDSSGDYQQELTAQIAEQQCEIDALTKQLDKTKEESIKGAEAAAEIVAQCGADEPIEAETKQELDGDDLWSEYHAISSNADKVTFYRKHRNQLLKNR